MREGLSRETEEWNKQAMGGEVRPLALETSIAQDMGAPSKFSFSYVSLYVGWLVSHWVLHKVERLAALDI